MKEKDPDRPKTRVECINGPRPCPWAGCRHNLFLDVTSKGRLKILRPELDDPSQFEGSNCVLDIVEEEGQMTYGEIGKVLNLTRERARQINDKALRKMRPKP